MLSIFIAGCIVLSFGAMFVTDKLCDKYSNYRNGLHITGRELVNEFAKEKEIENLKALPNDEDDYFDVVKKTIHLSEKTYNKDTVTAMAISAHECGHALQSKHGSIMLKIKRDFTYYVNVCIYIAATMLSVGYVAKIDSLMDVATVLMALSLLFHFFTLPIEIDASKKALKYLESKNIDKDELKAVKFLLTAAAISYFGNLFYNVIHMFKSTWTVKKRVVDFNAIN